jgi:DNA-binding IclR family transcriptional regulator
MIEILKYLKEHGQGLDSEIAKATRYPLSKVRLLLLELASKGEVLSCSTTRFVGGEKIEGIFSRISGYSPPAAPGRKPKVE